MRTAGCPGGKENDKQQHAGESANGPQPRAWMGDMGHLRTSVSAAGPRPDLYEGRRLGGLEEIPGFASPPRDGFALSD